MPLNVNLINNWVAVTQNKSLNSIYCISGGLQFGTVQQIPSNVDAVVVGQSVLFVENKSSVIQDNDGTNYNLVNVNDVFLIEKEPL